MRALIAAGYEAVFITEHEFVWPEAEIRNLQELFPQIRIFPGVELMLAENSAEHMLVLGTTDVQYVRLQFAPDRVLEKARKEGRLTVLAHPFRWPGGAELLGRDQLPDAIEYLTNNHSTEMAELARSAAKQYGLNLVNAGDVHTVEMIGRYWIESHKPLANADDIRNVIVNGQYRLRIKGR